MRCPGFRRLVTTCFAAVMMTLPAVAQPVPEQRIRDVGGSGDGRLTAIPDESWILDGFMCTTSNFFGRHATAKSVRPIFRDRNGETVGKWSGKPNGKISGVEATGGYVFAGIIDKGGPRGNGMRLIDVREKDVHLKPDDTNRSKGIGRLSSSRETLRAANRFPVIGIHGCHGNDLEALGCLQADSPPAPAPMHIKRT